MAELNEILELTETSHYLRNERIAEREAKKCLLPNGSAQKYCYHDEHCNVKDNIILPLHLSKERFYHSTSSLSDIHNRQQDEFLQLMPTNYRQEPATCSNNLDVRPNDDLSPVESDFYHISTVPSIWTHYDPYHDANYSLEIPQSVVTNKDIINQHSQNAQHSGDESGTDEDVFKLNRDYSSGCFRDHTLHKLLGTTLHPGWKLSYQDFSPDIGGYEDGYITSREKFSDLVKKANTWLRQNPQLQVKTCETLTWTTSNHILLGDTETVILDRCHCPSIDLETYHITGLRIWIAPKEFCDLDRGIECSNYCPIAFRDFKTRNKDNETLNDLIAQVNEDLDNDWIKGEILCISSLYVPDFPRWDPERLLWRESQCRNGQSRMFLRIFYVAGKPSRENIGIKDITPDATQGNWDSFSLLMKKSTTWIRKETSLYVTNLQSIYVEKKNDNVKESAENCCQSFRNFNTQQCFQLLRLYYVKRRHCSTKSIKPNQHVINCMTFTPVQTTLGPNTEAEFERMKQTMSRIAAWLELAGAVIRSAETFITPVLSSSANHTLPEMTHWEPVMLSNLRSSNVRKYLMHIRVYLEGDFSDPDPRLLPPLPYSLTIALQSSIQEREYKKYYKQKKTRQKRRKITVLVFLVVLLVAVGIILFDQLFDIFRRFS